MKKSQNTKKYLTANPLKQKLISQFLEGIYFEVERVKPKTILDVGCGEGFIDAFLIEKMPEISIVGIDNNKNALKKAKELAPVLKVREGDIYALPFKNKSFDMVLCIEVLEHLDTPSKALVELKRVTNKYCLISVPCEPFFRISNFLGAKNTTRFGNDPEHIQHWTKKEFCQLVEKHFRIKRIASPFPWTVILGET